MHKLIISLFLTSNLYAATSGTLVLRGYVSKKVEVNVTPLSISQILDLETTVTNLQVATLTGKSNVNNGFKLSVSSLNNGKLVNTTDPLATVDYTMKIDNTLIPLNGTGVLNYTSLGTFIKNINISYIGVDPLVYTEGEYNDTDIFTITAN
jgi:hypothetical protein